jgi:hypothetical protein
MDRLKVRDIAWHMQQENLPFAVANDLVATQQALENDTRRIVMAAFENDVSPRFVAPYRDGQAKENFGVICGKPCSRFQLPDQRIELRQRPHQYASNVIVSAFDSGTEGPRFSKAIEGIVITPS